MENRITLRETLFPNPELGRCICFHTVDHSDGAVSLYSIPFDFFGDGGDDDDVNSSNPDVEGLVPFYKSTGLPTRSTLSSVGSSLFVVGGNETFMEWTPSDKIYRFDTTPPPADGWLAISMLSPRKSPETVVMDGKLYMFGGCGPNYTFAEMFDPCLISSTSVPLPTPPCWPTNYWFPWVVVAALQPSKKILVASTDVAFLYNVVDRVWEEWDHKVDFSRVQGQAAVARNNTLLCWCSKDAEEVHAYDLVLRRWFISRINGLDKFGKLEPDEPRMFCPLVPLDDNHLCLLWERQLGYFGTELPLVHCNKIRVSFYADTQGESTFDAVVVASRSYVLLGRDEIIFGAHVFLGEEDEGGERGGGLGGHDHGGRTWERCGYGGGNKMSLGIAPFKICPKCLFPGHMERDCKGMPCSRCRGFGHMAKDCKGIPYCIAGGLIGQPPIQ
ncbi:hypothetical protein RHSIM_Rhsim03G0039300 [Rhododendron simsii]|uniref:CCHC-type domain-containing protein n=1 Tax=Rhododendron simsii TaxID=118357 RepID=A0A834LVB5_RHOSS|nr:hypothetical protein RHSIM_Rhsim03G0039300 [Rhododendron simsii]